MDQLLIIIQICLLIFSVIFVLKSTQNAEEKQMSVKERKPVVGFKARHYLTVINRSHRE
ncbi:hypothetical protein [Cellulophaga sp. BC115SP]|uniref:hypothetical protein n=1 Tax=Cellulophaga sp. BC115SP TaxID=2683263 RepID=UPI0014132954|nr:hypothetical protein [Cellulophaga sp. BC115SP]NBB31745.1 hypothetical protein [Cellulophaga sp. BC115SP]